MLEFSKRGRPQTPRRLVDDPLQGTRIEQIVREPEIRENILDLAAFKEPGIADQRIRHLAMHQDLLEQSSLGARPEKDRTIRVTIPDLVHEPLDFARDEIRFVPVRM